MSLIYTFVNNFQKVEKMEEDFTLKIVGAELKENVFKGMNLQDNGSFDMYINFNECLIDVFLDKVVVYSNKFDVTLNLQE